MSTLILRVYMDQDIAGVAELLTRHLSAHNPPKPTRHRRTHVSTYPPLAFMAATAYKAP